MVTYNAVTCNTLQTVISFLSQYTLSNLTSQQFLTYQGGESTSTNLDRLLRSNTSDLRTSNQQLVGSEDFDNIEISPGTTFYLDNSNIKREILRPVEPSTVTPADFKSFIANALDQLIRDPRYTTTLIDSGDNDVGSVVVNEFTVLMWIRSLSPTYSPGDGTWVNVTSFIESVKINSNGEGGTFSLVANSISCQPSVQKGWEFKNDVFGSDVLVTESIFKNPDNKGYQRNDFFFHTAVQKNDLVMIRFEKLDLEGKRPTDFDISSSDITGTDKVYDLIGMVDLTRITHTPNSVSVVISGRDLTKILIDENSVFFQEQYMTSIFATDGVLRQRHILEQDLHNLAFATYTNKTIDTILKFIFNKYSNIGYVPDSVMGVWGDRAQTQKYELTSTTSTSSSSLLSSASQTLLQQTRKGLWQIMELIVDKQVASRVLTDNNIVHDQGSILNGMHKICQMPFVQFYTDTYGDKFYWIVRKPPFDRKGYQGMIDDTYTTQSTISEQQGDQSFTNPTIVVKEPTITSYHGLVIDIDDVNVLSDDLNYHDEVYTWFRLVPRGLNVIDLQSFALIPLVTLDAYAEVWGSRPFSVEYNYCPAEYVFDSNVTAPVNSVESQVFADLQFLVQSYQYLPFARKGRITIDADRRIKKGMMIRYKPTKEIFYVDAVGHSRSVTGGKNERSTEITVTRGLREDYIKGVDVSFATGVKTVSYFNIVPTDIPSDASATKKDFLRNWTPDLDIFNFFLQRQQWA